MEDITMEKLLTDLKSVISEIDQLVANKDIEGARKVLTQIAELVAKEKGIPLDQVDDHSYDHVLHQLLKNISGVIEISEEKEEDVDLSDLYGELSNIEELLKQEDPDVLRKDLELQLEKVNAKISKYESKLATLRAAEVKEPLSRKDRNALNRRKDTAQQELDDVRKRIAEKKAEIEDLTTRRDKEATKGKFIETTEVVIDETPEDLRNQAEYALEAYAREHGIDKSELRIERQEIKAYDDGPKNTFKIVRVKQEEIVPLTNEQRSAYEREAAELDEKIKKLSEPELDPELSKGAQTLRARADAHMAEIEKLNAQIETIRNDKSQNKNNRIQAILKQINERKRAADKLYEQAEEMLARAGAKKEITPEQEAERENLEARLTEIKAILDRDDQVKNSILTAEERKKLEEQLGKLQEDIGLEGQDVNVIDEIKKALITAINLEEITPDEKKAKIDALDGMSSNDLMAELDRLTIVLRDKIVTLNSSAYARQENREADREPYDEAKKRLETLKKMAVIKSKLKKDDELIAKNPNVQELDEQIAIAQAELAKLEAEEKSKQAELQEIEQEIAEDDAVKKYKSNLRAKIRRAEKSLEKVIAERTSIETRISEIPEKVDKGALLKRKAEIEAEIEKRKAEKGKTVVSDKLDLGEEAAKIGDKIFKTADIRRELTDRDISREDFLAFYQAGLEAAKKNVEFLDRESQSLMDESGNAFTDKDSKEDLAKQILEAREAGDTKKLAAIYDKVRQNMIEGGTFKGILEQSGLVDIDFNVPENLDKMTEFVDKFNDLVMEQVNKLRAESRDQQENIEIFEREIKIIEAEKAALRDGATAEITEKSKREKALRAKQITATMFEDEGMKQEWDERMARFASHRKEEIFEYVDKDGNLQRVPYTTMAEYDEMGDDAFFLNLEDYKTNIELVTKFEKSGYDISVLPPEMTEGKNIAQIKEEMAERAEYVRTFHGLTNEHAVRYENLRTAGSTLKAMKPVKGDLPATTKMANAVENTFRFLGIRKPEFHKVNENGEKVLDIRGGLTTLALDAALVGGIAVSTAVGGPLVLAGVGVGYAAKGAVLLGNLGAAKIEQARFGDEIADNLPTPFERAKDAREVARKEYYREVEGMGKFTSWVKAKADRLPFFRNRARETEQAIVDSRIALSDATIDERDKKAIETIGENAEKAKQNQERRQEAYRVTARSANTYNDIIRDPSSVDKDVAAAAIARNAAIQSNGSKTIESVNPSSQVPRTDQYVKPEEELKRTDELDEVVTEGGSIASTAITEEQVYTGEMQRIDRWNKVATMILTVAGNIGLKAITDGFNKTEIIEKQGQDQVIEREVQVPKYEEVTTTEVDPSVKLSELEYGKSGVDNIYGAPQTGGATVDDVNAIAVGVRGPDGRMIEVSIAEAGGPFTTNHVHGIVDQDISNLSMENIVKLLRNADGGNLDKYLDAVGLPRDATDADIAKCILEKGHLNGQSSRMEGWNIADASSSFITKTEKVLKGFETITETEIIPGEIIREEITSFDSSKVVEAAIDGGIIGAGMAGIDQAHEANVQTKKVDPGTHEKKNPLLAISKLAKRAQERLNKERENEQRRDDEESSHDEK